MPGPFNVLFVCTGNICRSPMGERLLAARVPGELVIVASAGTHGLRGHPMDAPSARVLRELGGEPDGHVARRMDAGTIGGADLVLGATREHRAAVLAAVPLAFRRTFTMREFGRLGAALGPLERPDADGLRARVRDVASRRGFVPVPDPESADDIGDPFGASLDGARRTGREVASAVDAIVASLGLQATGSV